VLFVKLSRSKKSPFYAYFPPFFLALLTQINFLLVFCLKVRLLTAKCKPTKEANEPSVSIAS
jgi:hypothetical protein